MNSIMATPMAEKPVSLTESVVFGITRQILDARRSLDNEETSPGRDADSSEDKIANLKTRIAVLRDLRDKYEAEMAKGS